MGRPPTDDDNALERALEAARSTGDANALRAAQATLMPLLGFSLERTGQAVGRDRYWVSRARSRFLRGLSPQKKHGGRRHSLVAEDEEVALLRKAIEQPGTWFLGRASVRSALRSLLDDEAAQPVSDSAITALMNRAAPKLVSGARGADIEVIAAALARKWICDEIIARQLSPDR